MMRTLTVLFVCVVLFLGCSTTETIREPITYKEINKKLREQEATIELQDDKTLPVKDGLIFSDSISWVNMNTKVESTASIKQVKKIVITQRSHFLGGLEGLVFGIVGGGGLGWLLGGGLSARSGSDAGIIAFAHTIVGAGVGGGIGLIVGTAIGHKFHSEFQREFIIQDSSDVIRKLSTKPDVIYLKDGSIIAGKIIAEIKEGNKVVQIVIRDFDDVLHNLNAESIERIEKSE